MAAEVFDDIILTDPNGIWTDSRGYSSFLELVLACGSSVQNIVIAQTEVIDDDLVIPTTYTLHFLNGGSLQPTEGHLITVPRGVSAEKGPIFGGAGSFAFEDGSVVKLSWFPTPESAFDNTATSVCTLLIDTPATITGDPVVGGDVSLAWRSPGCELTVSGSLNGIDVVEAGKFVIFQGAGTFLFLDRISVCSSWFPTIAEAVAAIGSTTATLWVDRSETVAGDLSIPANVDLWFNPEVQITIDTGITITGYGRAFGLRNPFTGAGEWDNASTSPAFIETWNTFELFAPTEPVDLTIFVTKDGVIQAVNESIEVARITADKLLIGADTEYEPGTWSPTELYDYTASVNDALTALSEPGGPIDLANQNANSAITLANGKNKMYISNVQPPGTSFVTGDLWWYTTTYPVLKVWNGSNWVDVADSTAVSLDRGVVFAGAAAVRNPLGYVAAGIQGGSGTTVRIWAGSNVLAGGPASTWDLTTINNAPFRVTYDGVCTANQLVVEDQNPADTSLGLKILGSGGKYTHLINGNLFYYDGTNKFSLLSRREEGSAQGGSRVLFSQPFRGTPAITVVPQKIKTFNRGTNEMQYVEAYGIPVYLGGGAGDIPCHGIDIVCELKAGTVQSIDATSRTINEGTSSRTFVTGANATGFKLTLTTQGIYSAVSGYVVALADFNVSIGYRITGSGATFTPWKSEGHHKTTSDVLTLEYEATGLTPNASGFDVQVTVGSWSNNGITTTGYGTGRTAYLTYSAGTILTRVEHGTARWIAEGL